jgi:hypothetical protein
MPFDLSTARPANQVSGGGGFDLSTARPVQQPVPQDRGFDLESFDPAGEIAPPPAQQPDRQTVVNLAQEFAAGVNRPIFQLIDAFGTDTVNAALNLVGSQRQIPGMMETFGAERGEFAGEGLGTDIASAAGELAATGGLVGGGLRVASRALPQFTKGEGALTGVAREVTKVKPTTEVGLGALSGVGQEVGREVGGETGAIVGGIAAPLAGAVGGQAARGLGGDIKESLLSNPVIAQKFSKNTQLIDQVTGLPAPRFERELKKQGLTLGSIVDEPELLPLVRANQSPEQVAKQIAVRKLKFGTSDQGLADKKLVNTGKGFDVRPDELAADTIKKGWGRGFVGNVKASNDHTQKAMVKMLNNRRRVMADEGLDVRPLDVAGDEVVKQFNYVRNQTLSLRGELDKASKALKGKRINTANAEGRLFEFLEGINIIPPDNVVNNPVLIKQFLDDPTVFNQTTIASDPSAQKLIRNTVNLLSKSSDDAFRAHILKKQLDNLIDFNRSESQLTPMGERFAKSMRAEVNNAVREVSPSYAAVNDKLSGAIGTIDSLIRPLPKSVRDNIYQPDLDRSVGRQLRKLESNYATGDELNRAINQLTETAEGLGGDFPVEIRRLVNFNSALNDRFGAVERGSLAGQQAIGTKEAIRATQQPLEALKEKAVEKALKFISPDDEQALNSMQRLLKRVE